ncbi:acyltransferase [Aeromicrobium sp. 9AM]|uniref:acyltransferase family protein n=1 Tax=Aeromicrobium sp. 9AM TaxID=2653126 RepID=UPI0012F0DA7E|nr:acyltransferase [Aeromicrobium sp. 9AM]VXB99478.1 conserved membrane hypothetical protein [Aeromicrobium sp. 9AM]
MTNASTPRFPGLDSLRAIASIAVVATHTCFWAGVYGNGTLGSAMQRLEVGVAVFFVLSGFLLSYPFVTQLRTGRRHDSTRRYFWKRSLRILPVYWVAVVAALVLLPANHSLGVSRWLDNLLLIDLYLNPALPHGLTQMWSLSTEVAFYLVLPLLMWLLTTYVARRRWAPRRLLVTLGVLSVLSLGWTALAASALKHVEGMHRALPSYFIWFAIGIALAVLDVDRRHRAAPSRNRLVDGVTVLASSAGTCWLLALAVFTIASTPLAGTPGLVAIAAGESVIRTGLYALVALLVVLPSVLGDQQSAYARTLAHPFLRHLGHISYSLFCCHVLVLELEARWFGFRLFQSDPFVLFAVTLTISLVIAELLYRFVEMPFLRWKDARSTAPDTRQPIAITTSS